MTASRRCSPMLCQHSDFWCIVLNGAIVALVGGVLILRLVLRDR